MAGTPCGTTPAPPRSGSVPGGGAGWGGVWWGDPTCERRQRSRWRNSHPRRVHVLVERPGRAAVLLPAVVVVRAGALERRRHVVIVGRGAAGPTTPDCALCGFRCVCTWYAGVPAAQKRSRAAADTQAICAPRGTRLRRALPPHPLCTTRAAGCARPPTQQRRSPVAGISCRSSRRLLPHAPPPAAATEPPNPCSSASGGRAQRPAITRRGRERRARPSPHPAPPAGGSSAWERSRGAAPGAAAAMAALPLPPIIQEQWVQCENAHCNKWRKLPRGAPKVKEDESWYCYMNPDPARAGCSASEEVRSRQRRRWGCTRQPDRAPRVCSPAAAAARAQRAALLMVQAAGARRLRCTDPPPPTPLAAGV